MRQKIIFAFTALLFLAMLNAQSIGEIAGSINFQVAPGHNQTLPMYIINSGSAPIKLQVLNDYSLQYKSQIANQIAPNITVNPQNFTLNAGKEQAINITVSMPSKDALNDSWEGIIQVVEVQNASNINGAVLNIGVAKLFSITSVKYIPPKTNTTVVKTSSPLINYFINNQLGLHVLEGFVGIAIIGGVVVYLIWYEKNRRKLKAEAAKKAKKEQRVYKTPARKAEKTKKRTTRTKTKGKTKNKKR